MSSTRAAPHNGELAKAARNWRAPKAPLEAATSTVRSSRRRSRCCASRRAKGDEGAFAEGWRGGIQAVQDELPAAIHEGGLDDVVIGDATIGLQDHGKRQLSRRHRRVALRGSLREGGEFRLEGRSEEGMALLAQEDKELGAAHALNDVLFGGRELKRWLPEERAHAVRAFLLVFSVTTHHATTSEQNT